MNLSVQPQRAYVPHQLDATQWTALEPLYRGLLEREIPDVAALEAWLLDRSELDAAASEARAELYIRMTCHTDDAQAQQAYARFMQETMPELTRISSELDRKLVESPQAQALPPERHEVLIRDARVDIELFREENVPLQTENSRLSQEYQQRMGGLTVHFQGREHTMPEMGRYQDDPDRATREAAWRATAERRLQEAEPIEALFEQMIPLRHQMARNAGFENYRDYMFRARKRFDYGPEDCLRLHESLARACHPLAERLDAERAEALGLEALRPWDREVDPLGRPPLRPFRDARELDALVHKVFLKLDPELAGLYQRLGREDCLDLETRPGKAPGGYQASRDLARRPFIFMNAAGLDGDLRTLFHEAGHAFHSLLCATEPLVDYRHAPIEFAEVASMSMELLVLPFMGEIYPPDEADRSRRRQLEGVLRILPYVCLVDAFQHWIYLNPQHSREERREQWLELHERFSPPGDWSGLDHERQTLWHRIGHPFTVPFYMIEYAIAQLGALALWQRAQQDPDGALEDYKQALSLGGSRPLPELFHAAGLPWDFGPETVGSLIDTLDQQLQRLPR